MKYTLKRNMRLSFDGINVDEYIAGEPYEPRNNHEKRVFEDLVRKGKAEEYFSPSKVAEPKSTKVTLPVAEKALEKPKSAPKKRKKTKPSDDK